ncbi:hypothetical protein XENOCAPTIV_010003 [Xenoophorus captivus]|uniref:Uncharacterized protein n=1 Tax=Xenoophorus captivus TaxID=1517983 RepID=A0ABV0R7X0_9TELE
MHLLDNWRKDCVNMCSFLCLPSVFCLCDDSMNHTFNVMDLPLSQGDVDNSVDMDRLNRNMPEFGRQTHQVLQSTPLDLIETGKGLKFQAERPHLVSLGSGRLSTAITLLPLPEGEPAVSTQTQHTRSRQLAQKLIQKAPKYFTVSRENRADEERSQKI